MKTTFAFLLWLLFSLPVFSQLSINATGTAVTVDFDNSIAGVINGQFTAPATYATATPIAGELDRDAFQVSSASGTGFNWPALAGDLTGGLGISAGSVTAGGIYAFTDNGGLNRFLGFQASGTAFTPGAIILRVQNNSGLLASGFEVSYRGLYINDQGRESSITGYYSLDGTTWTALPNSFNFATPVAATGGNWVSTLYGSGPQSTPIPNAAFLYLKWVTDDVSGAGSRDEIGIDDIAVTLQGGPCNTAPTFNATSFSATATSDSSLTLSWSNGDGQARILIARSGAAITATPADNNTYAADSHFGNGTHLGGNQYVVYNGPGSSLTVTGLTPGQLYYFALYEYNCSPGNERYLSPGLTGSGSSLPANVSNFSVGCVTNTTVQLSWNLPTGNYDGILIFAREGGVPADPIADETAYTGANANFALAPAFGARGNLVYKGNGSNVTISGLTPDSSYTFKVFTYLNSTNTLWSTGTQRTVTAEFNPVTGLSALPANNQATVSWTNPAAGCFDEVIVVINLAPGIGFTPSGTGMAYTANPFYLGPNQVVYKGTGTSATVNGLTNGVTYYFEVFVRQGTTWSKGRETSATPGIELFPGDLLIIGFDNNVNGGIDKLVLTNLVDLPAGTSFSIANATYELFAGSDTRTGKWYSADGNGTNAVSSQRITYLGATPIARGSILCLELPTNLGVLISTLTVNGVALTAGADFVSAEDAVPNGVVNFSTSNPDAIFLVQGAWILNTDHALLNGRVLGGIQDGAPWYLVSDDLSNLTSGPDMRRSRIPPSIRCFAIQGRTSIGTYFASYTGTQSGTKRSLISNITDFAANWTGGNGDGSDNLPGTICSSTFTFTGNTTPGLWVGDADDNWFNCANWDNFEVPDEQVDVTVAGGTFEANVSAFAPYSDEFSDTARCGSLLISGPQKVELDSSRQNVLLVTGDLRITGSGVLDMQDGLDATEDGQLLLHGNWDNQRTEAAFQEGNGTVIFLGQGPQAASAPGGEAFFNLEVNKNTGELTLNSDLTLDAAFANDNVNDGQLFLTRGKVNANGHVLAIHNHNGNAITNFSANSYVYGGILRRAIEGSSSFAFPVGNALFYELATVNFTSPGVGSATFLDASFNPLTGSAPNFNEGPYVYNELLDAGLWTLTPNAAFAGTYNLNLLETGYSNGGAPAYTITHRTDAATAWGTQGTAGPWFDTGNEVGVIRNGLNSFSDFAIARPQPLSSQRLELFAVKVEGGVHLTWELAGYPSDSELFFRRSSDGINFLKIAALPARQSGETWDTDPLPGLNHYQLLLVDQAGNASLSSVKSVWIASGKKEDIFTLFPNPTSGRITIRSHQTGGGTLNIQLLSGEGRAIYHNSIGLPGGYVEKEIDLSDLPAGIYFYRIRISEQVYTGRIAKISP